MAIFEFRHRDRSVKRWLHVEANATAEPTALYNDLRVAGWTEKYAPIPAHPAWADLFTPNPQMIQEREFERDGADWDWSPTEKRQFMGACRRILRKHGVTGVAVRTMYLEDLL